MKSMIVPQIKRPITASVSVPGSKSYTLRALLLGAITTGTIELQGVLYSEDTEAMIDCLSILGIKIDKQPNKLVISSDLSTIADKKYILDADLSGVSIRSLLALCAVIPGTQILHGKEGLNKRPIGELVDGLRQLGADIQYLENEGFPPLQINSSSLKSGTVRMRGDISSQYFSAILQIAPLVKGGLTIEVGGKQASKPYIDMTIDIMKTFDVEINNNNYKSYHVASGQTYKCSEYIVEGDVSSACYFWAIAALTKSTITVNNLNPDSKQADMQVLGVLEQMGSRIIRQKNSITVIGSGVKPVDVDTEDYPDQAMTLAVLAAFAPGTSTLSGVRSLRIKESERVVAVETELAKMGIKTSSTADVLKVQGGNPKLAEIDTYGDHRIAMSFAIAGTKLSGLVINNPQVVGKTFPEFWDKLNDMTITEGVDNIVLIGMRGSGKSTVSKLLAKRLNKEYICIDELVPKQAKMSIKDIVAQYGWPRFRDLEMKAVQTASKQHNSVISTGGGVVLRQENVDTLRKNGTLVFLTAPVEDLVARVENDDAHHRPSLTEHAHLLAEITELWNQREPLYRNAADIVIDTQDLDAEEVANQIIKQIGKGQI